MGNGVDLYSSTAGSDSDYGFSSGTSMSAPNVAGTATLLIEHFENEFGYAPRSATTKGLLVHTASDAGNVGPDYAYGWGLVNAKKAAELITGAASAVTTDTILEGTYSGSEQTWDVDVSALNPFRVSIVWTDPAGTDQGPGLDVTTSPPSNASHQYTVQESRKHRSAECENAIRENDLPADDSRGREGIGNIIRLPHQPGNGCTRRHA